MSDSGNRNKEVEGYSENEIKLEQVMGEELTDEQLLQMAEGSCSWGANCRG